MDVFIYGKKEIDYLKKRDKILGKAIDEIGMIQRPVIPDLFSALIRNVVGQQISSRAAATVWTRFLEKYSPISPKTIAEADTEDIQKCGMSMRKAGYIKGIAEAVWGNKLNLSELVDLPDEEVIKKLSSLPGIGLWTAEMLMIFSMQRPDVVSYGDLAIRRGMMTLYGLESLSKEEFLKYRKAYSPYGSVASLYLWVVSKE